MTLYISGRQSPVCSLLTESLLKATEALTNVDVRYGTLYRTTGWSHAVAVIQKNGQDVAVRVEYTVIPPYHTMEAIHEFLFVPTFPTISSLRLEQLWCELC